MENYYKILQVIDFAEIEVVRAAYKAMTKLYHPDVNSNVDPSVMVKINLAYEVLGDINKKSDYDRQLKRYLRTATNKKSNTSHSMQNDSKPHSTEAEVNTKRVPKTKIEKAAKAVGDVLWFTADAVMEGVREFQRDVEQAYLKGSEYNDLTLVKQYLKATGAKKQGFSKVLIERGLLKKENGEIVPSYEFKQIAKYI